MDKKDYLDRLLKLKQFLKEHPDQRKVYSDINLSREILATKHEIMIEEENAYEQDRLLFDGFKKTDANPFL